MPSSMFWSRLILLCTLVLCSLVVTTWHATRAWSRGNAIEDYVSPSEDTDTLESNEDDQTQVADHGEIGETVMKDVKKIAKQVVGAVEQKDILKRDPLFELLSGMVTEIPFVHAERLMNTTPTLLQEARNLSQTMGISSDKPIRQYLDNLTGKTTDWRALSDHALRERDDMLTHSNKKELPAFPYQDMVLDPTQKWTVPMKRPPVCIVSKQDAAKLCPTQDQSGLIGTLLSDAKHTSIGSILPKFEFHQVD